MMKSPVVQCLVVFNLIISSNLKSEAVNKKEDNLRCEVPRAQMLEQWMWSKKSRETKKKEKVEMRIFDFQNLDSKKPLLFDSVTRVFKHINSRRKGQIIELFHFQSYNFNENFEINLNTMTVRYTQIFRDLGSSAQFFVSEGQCEFVKI